MRNIRSVFVSETPFPSPKNVSFILEEYPPTTRAEIKNTELEQLSACSSVGMILITLDLLFPRL